ncbi:MAG: hypothetical protein D6724_08855 [Armatimonadetes bacterium]|nr:MAG: hypothetical protein D6724_08855 [Armatimonadota bacterium]
MAKNVRKNRNRRAGWVAVSLLVLVGVGFSVEQLVPPRAPEGYRFGEVSLAGKTRSEVEQVFSTWWENESTREIGFSSHLVSKPIPPITIAQAGVRADIEGMLAQVPFRGFYATLLNSKDEAVEVEPRYTTGSADLDALAQFVEDHGLSERPARVYYKNGKIQRQYEVPSFEFDPDAVPERVITALEQGKHEIELPVRITKPHIPKEAVDQIVEVMTTFTTKFNTGDRNRSSNIATAASRINGLVLLPGETFSYNGTVGKRSAKTGFKPAGVYASGRHEVDYGGGICQVSTTLFNAALLANLDIVERSNHSMPVPYVPIGRDATVDYGNIDLKFKNPYDFPIAISLEVSGGTLTARILGRKDETTEVRIVVNGFSSWANTVKYIDDPSLEPGQEVVEEKGSTGRKCTTWRIVLKNGKEVKREQIGTSTYRAWPRIVRRNPNRPEINPTQEGAAPDDGGAEPPIASARSNRDSARG